VFKLLIFGQFKSYLEKKKMKFMNI